MAGVRVVVGPVDALAARAWVAQARTVNELVRNGLALPFAVPPEVVEAFDRSLEEWAAIAQAGPTFEWVGEYDADTLRRLVQYWFNLVQFLLENADGVEIPLLPLEALPFRDALIPAVVAALAEDERSGPFGRSAGERWPGRTLTQYPYGKAGRPSTP